MKKLKARVTDAAIIGVPAILFIGAAGTSHYLFLRAVFG